eukprot:3699712-Pleurochrysis_carterae.AAC.1
MLALTPHPSHPPSALLLIPPTALRPISLPGPCPPPNAQAANLLLTRAGELRLADFGVSVQLSNSLSRRSTAIGTP